MAGHSLRGGWTDPQTWWTPGVESVAEALAGNSHTDDVEAGAVLGSERAALGFFIDEARADLLVGTKIAGAKPSQVAQLVYGLTMGWVDQTLHDLYVADCVDPLTGLCSLAHLTVRLNELYDDAEVRGWRVLDRYKLLVVEVDRTVERLLCETRLITVQTSMRMAFHGGETLARLAPTRAVAVVRQETTLSSHIARLSDELRLARTEGRLPGFRMWIESCHPRATDSRPCSASWRSINPTCRSCPPSGQFSSRKKILAVWRHHCPSPAY